MSYMNGCVLVTGGAGFIGSHLVERLLLLGARVVVIDNLQAGSWASLSTCRTRVNCLEADVRDGGAMQRVIADTRPDYVFHLAANASVPGSVENPRYDFETNSGGTFALLEACRMCEGIKRIVITSSGAVYGEPTQFPITENSPLIPISPYGASKLGSEVEARMFATVYKVPVTIARLFNTYGPRMPRFVVLDFLRKLQISPDRLEILGSGEQVRDLNYVDDTVSGFLTLGLRGVPGEAYNVASGASHNVTQIAEMLLAGLGLSERTRLEYTGQSWAGDAQRWEVDISQIQKMGYAPEVSLAEGLRRVTEWYECRFGRIRR
jgi:UDP-glucose 4-epimerase